MKDVNKICVYQGLVIAKNPDSLYFVFTKEEWAFGEGMRYPEWECENVEEAMDFIDSY